MTSVLEDVLAIHALCGLYGFCYGALVVTESLMLADAFGIDKLSAGYGILNGLKGVAVLLLSSFISPAAAFVYTAHPFTGIVTWNQTTCSGLGCDPFRKHRVELC